MDWDTSCPDWQDRILSGRSLVPDLPLFRAEAERALRVFKRLRIPDMQGLPTMGDVAGPWLFPIVEAIFGCYDDQAMRRMIAEFFWMIPKKNTKSSSAAAIMVEALILNRRPEGEYALIAPTKEIADISYSQAAGTIRADSELDKLFQVQQHLRRIQHRRTGAELKVKAADTDVITGGKQVGTLIDELHVLSAKKAAADLLIELRGALAARPDGFLITITTQSKAPPSGVFKAELQKARDVRDGKIKLPLLPILYELPPEIVEGGRWKERRYWSAVNPNLGRSVDEPFLTRELAAAEMGDAGMLALFASQHFNVEIGMALRADRWRGADHWLAAAEPGLTLDEIIARCEVICVGIDGGGLDDLFGLGVVGRERRPEADVSKRRWFAWNRAWCHESVLELRKSEAPKLRDFESAGELTICKTVGDDIEQIIAIVKQIDEAALLAEVGLDPVGIGAVVDALDAIGISGDERIKGVSQGFRLMGAIKTAERKLVDKTLVHAGQDLMTWCVGNARNEPRGNAMMITKAASGTGKIDPLMALFNAIALMSMNPEAVQTRSVYETRGLRVA